MKEEGLAVFTGKCVCNAVCIFVFHDIFYHSFLAIRFFKNILYDLAECRKVVIIGDSIITLKPFPGATIGKLGYIIESEGINLQPYDYLILHVGTNIIVSAKYDGIIFIMPI